MIQARQEREYWACRTTAASCSAAWASGTRPRTTSTCRWNSSPARRQLRLGRPARWSARDWGRGAGQGEQAGARAGRVERFLPPAAAAVKEITLRRSLPCVWPRGTWRAFAGLLAYVSTKGLNYKQARDERTAGGRGPGPWPPAPSATSRSCARPSRKSRRTRTRKNPAALPGERRAVLYRAGHEGGAEVAPAGRRARPRRLRLDEPVPGADAPPPRPRGGGQNLARQREGGGAAARQAQGAAEPVEGGVPVRAGGSRSWIWTAGGPGLHARSCRRRRHCWRRGRSNCIVKPRRGSGALYQALRYRVAASRSTGAFFARCLK